MQNGLDWQAEFYDLFHWLFFSLIANANRYTAEFMNPMATSYPDTPLHLLSEFLSEQSGILGCIYWILLVGLVV